MTLLEFYLEKKKELENLKEQFQKSVEELLPHEAGQEVKYYDIYYYENHIEIKYYIYTHHTNWYGKKLHKEESKIIKFNSGENFKEIYRKHQEIKELENEITEFNHYFND